jgi:Flp pilus assembly protein TadG
MSDTLLRRLVRDVKGNIALIFAFASVPLIFSVGMGVDYTSAVMREDQLNSYADAAALAALRPSILAESDAASVTAAQNTFNAQAASLTGVTYDPAAVKVKVTDTLAGVAVTRKVTVSYTAASHNAFAGILGQQTITLSGSSQATSNAAPNINFYLLLDDSPSMAIAATQAGINTMVANTSAQGGCAFACHETTPANDNLGNPPNADGSVMDNFTLARNLGVTLRIDMLRQATQNLMTTALQTEQAANAQYQMAIYTFDLNFNTIQTLTPNLGQAQTQAGNIQTLEVYDNNCLTVSNCNSDQDTNYDTAMTQVNLTMPNPGNGTNAFGDSPQEVLFIVTDGVADENVNGTRTYAMTNTAQSQCTAIKARGIRIAILYTIYYPLPTNGWYNTYIAPIQSNISPTLQACASPGLFFAVDTGGDISAAMTTLFQTAVTTAYLSK